MITLKTAVHVYQLSEERGAPGRPLQSSSDRWLEGQRPNRSDRYLVLINSHNIVLVNSCKRTPHDAVSRRGRRLKAEMSAEVYLALDE